MREISGGRIMQVIEVKNLTIIIHGNHINIAAEKKSDKSTLRLLSRQTILVKKNKDGEINLESDVAVGIGGANEKYMDSYFVTRSTLEYCVKHPFFKELRAYYEQKKDIESSIVFYQKTSLQDGAVYILPSKKIYPQIQEYMIDCKSTNYAETKTSMSQSQLVNLKIFQDLFLPSSQILEEPLLENTPNVDEEIFFQSAILKSIGKSYKAEFKNGLDYNGVLLLIGRFTQSISSYSPKIDMSEYSSQYVLLKETVKHLFEPPTYLVGATKIQEEANKIIDGIDKSTTIAKTLFGYVAMIKEIMSLTGNITNVKNFIDTFSSDKYGIDEKFLSGHLALSGFLKLIQSIKTEVKTINLNDFSQKNNFINNVFHVNFPIYSCGSLVLFNGHFETYEDLDQCFKNISDDTPFYVTISKLSILNAIQSNEKLNFLMNFSIYERDDDTLIITGIHKKNHQESLSSSIRGKSINSKDFFLNNPSGDFYFQDASIKSFDYKKDVLTLTESRSKAFFELGNYLVENANITLSHGTNILNYFSELSSIGIKEKIFPNPAIANNIYSPRISVEDIAKNQVVINALALNPGMDTAIRSLAKRSNILIQKASNVIIKPTKGTIYLPPHAKEERISGSKNLGMTKFSYLPILDISNEDDKAFFKELLTKTFGELSDSEQLETTLQISKYVCILTRITFEKDLRLPKPTITLLNERGEAIKDLSIDIYKYAEILEKNNIVDYSHLVSSPTPTKNHVYTLLVGVNNFLSSAYKVILDKDVLAYATKLATSYHLARTQNPLISEETREQVLIQLQEAFFIPLTNNKVLSLDIKALTQDIKILPITPKEKNDLMSVLQQSNIIFSNTALEKLLLALPENTQKSIGAFVDKINKIIKQNQKKAEKEAYSFLYQTEMLMTIKMIQSEKDPIARGKILNKSYAILRNWAKNALDLFDEQIDAAINAIFLSKKNQEASFYIFHSMGTGKTRLALFYQILYLATNEDANSFFAIQNKNKTDIYEQLSEMLPSMIAFTNVYATEDITSVHQSSPIPHAIVDYIYPNIFTGATSGIFISKGQQNIKEKLSQTYARDVKAIIEWANKNEDYMNFFEKECKTVELKSIIDSYLEVYKQTILNHVYQLGSKHEEKDFFTYKNKAEKVLFSILTYIDKNILAGNIYPSSKNFRSITQKIEQTFTEYFLSAIEENTKNRAKKLSFISHSLFNRFPKEKEISTEYKIPNTKNTIFTKHNVDAILGQSIAPLNALESSALHHILSKVYEPSKIDLKNIWLLYSLSKDILASESNTLFEIKKEILTAIARNITQDIKIESAIDFDSIRDLVSVFCENIKYEEILESHCPVILNDGSPIKCEQIPLLSVLPDKNSFIEHVARITQKNDSIIVKKAAENLKNLFKDNEKIIHVINKHFFISFLTDIMNPSIKNKDKLKKMSLMNIPIVDLKLTIHVNLLSDEQKQGYIIGSTIDKKEDMTTSFSVYNGCTYRNTSEKSPYIEDESIIHGDQMVISFNGYTYAAEIIFNTFQPKIKTEINYSTPFLYSPYDMDNLKNDDLILYDEAHKKENQHQVIRTKVEMKLTGTPTNGTPSSVASILYSEDDDLKKTMATQMAIMSGIQRITNKFYISLLNLGELQEDFLFLCDHLNKKNINPLESKNEIKKLINKHTQIKNTLLEYLTDAEKSAKYNEIKQSQKEYEYLNQFLVSSESSEFYAVIEQVKKSLKKGFTGLEAIYNAIPTSEIIEYPGFSDPYTLGSIMRKTPSSRIKEISIDPGTKRVYNFIDIENALSGEIEFDQERTEEFINNTYLHEVSTFYQIIKQMGQEKQYESLINLFNTMCEVYLYSQNKKIQENMLDSIKNDLDIRGYDITGFKTSFPSIKDILAQISPETIGNLDSIHTIFKNKIVLVSSVDWDLSSDIKKSVIRVVSQHINDYLETFDKTVYYAKLKAILKNDENTFFENKAMLEPFEKDNSCKIDIDEMRAFSKILFNSKEYTIPMIGDIDVNLKCHFPKIFKKDIDAVPLKINLLHSKENEIFSEMYTDCIDRTVENLAKNKNSLILTTRVALLQLKFAEICNALLEKPQDRETYLIINEPSNAIFQNFVNAIDRKELLAAGIHILKTDPSNLYNTYNYKIPHDCNFVIMSNYASVAEGFRFPRVNETIVCGHPGNSMTLLQALSRTFFPGKVFDSNIYLAGKKASLTIDKYADLMDVREKIIHLLSTKPDPFNAQNWEFNKNFLELGTIPLKCKQIGLSTKSAFASMSESLLASLKFMNANFTGVTESSPDAFLRENISKENVSNALITPKMKQNFYKK